MSFATVSSDKEEQMLSWSATCEYQVVGILWVLKGKSE
jgi:hypothetical protein